MLRSPALSLVRATGPFRFKAVLFREHRFAPGLERPDLLAVGIHLRIDELLVDLGACGFQFLDALLQLGQAEPGQRVGRLVRPGGGLVR